MYGWITDPLFNSLDLSLMIHRILHLFVQFTLKLSSSYEYPAPRPFLKWAGGKNQLVKQLHRRLPNLSSIRTYHEIFGGGGSLLFSLIYKLENCRFYISDRNEQLINAFQVVRDDVDNLVTHLSTYQNSRVAYEEIRSWDRDPHFDERTSVETASRFIYLNKTCYNGLFRVNASGEFNVPFGKYKNPNICDETNLRACSRALQGVTLDVIDYNETLDRIGAGDFVYIDPPYEPISKTSNFNSYTIERFDEVDQTRLFKYCQALTRKRARFLLSNSSAPWLRQLYRKDTRFNIGYVKAQRSINSDKHGRGPVKEIVVRNY